MVVDVSGLQGCVSSYKSAISRDPTASDTTAAIWVRPQTV